MEKLQAQRRAQRGQCTKLTGRGDELLQIENPTEDHRRELQVIIERLKAKLQLLETIDKELMGNMKETSIEPFYEEADDYAFQIHQITAKFEDFHLSLKEKFSPHATPQADHNTSLRSSSSTSSQRSRVKLPRLTIPPFSGDLLKWQTFIDGFEAAVNNDDTLDDVQKFQYLQSNLRGEAAKTIEGLSLTNENYSHAMELLTSRYGKKHRIINAYMTALWKLPSPNTTLPSLTNFYDSMESYIRGLKALGKDEDTFGDILIPIVLEKLPASIRRQITRDNKGDDDWSLGKLRDAIKREIDSMDAGKEQTLNEHFDSNDSPPMTAAFATTTKQQQRHGKPQEFTGKKTWPCVFCQGTHKAKNCTVVSSKHERSNIVKNSKLCLNCFSRNHYVKDCKSPFRCLDCKQKHHTAICLGKPANQMDKNKTQEAAPNVHANYSSLGDTSEEIPTVLLKTAVTNIYAGPYTSQATVLFDEGAQRTFITEQMVNDLNIKTTDYETISLTTFGATSTGLRQLKVATVSLRSLHGEDIPVRALVIPKITTPMQNLVQKDIKLLPHLRTLTLAHPPSDYETMDITLLIGADHYWDFVGDHVIRGNGPVAVSSKLGYLLSGPITTNVNLADTKSVCINFISDNIRYEHNNQLKKFWNGPPWVKTGDLPTCPTVDSHAHAAIIAEEADLKVNTVECQPAPATTHGIVNIIDPARYSTWQRLLRVSALVLRFVNNVKATKENRSYSELTANEINDAELLWIKDTQKRYYENEHDGLKAKERSLGPLAKQLRLFLDTNDVIRVGGRLHNAPVRYDMKFPMLIPPKSAVAELIVKDCHLKNCHSGLQTTVTTIRQRFWITQIRTVVKTILRKCVTCRKVNGKPYRAPIPAPLQKDRLLEAPAFTICGVDFTGAIYVKEGSNEVKSYICLFTCAVTRAIHLELVRDLSTECFMRAFRRFAARRSLPKKMISDNGSTYLSAAEEIKKLYESPTVRNFLANRRVEWEFIPKRAPWYGGFWERLIGLTKTSLKKVLGRTFVSHDEIVTILSEIEAGLNDRPLTYVADDVEMLPLTPSHFMYGHAITTLPHDVDVEELHDPTFGQHEDLRHRYNRIGLILNDYWKRWSTEYLAALHEQDRISGKGLTQNNVKTGDVVLIEDKSVPRIKWHLGVVQHVYPGRDGLIRSVDLKTKKGTLNRPIKKLYPLEINSSIFEKCSEDKTDTTANSEQCIKDKTDSVRSTKRAVSTRQSAIHARRNIKKWTADLLD